MNWCKIYKLIIKINQYLNNNQNYSKLAELGNLSKYNYEQMDIILNNWSKTIKKTNEHFDVQWENKKTRIVIRYNNSTKYFIQIIEEEWKDCNMIFKNQLK